MDKRGGEYMDKEGEASKKQEKIAAHAVNVQGQQSTTEPEIITLQPGILVVLDAG